VEIVISVKPTCFDGTITLQKKALSAIIRLQESEPLAVIIDFYEAQKRLYSRKNMKKVRHTQWA
jgi:hypothetical protein